MTMSEQRPTSTRQARAGLEYALSTVAKPNPLVMAWRWRYELGGAAAITVVALVASAAISLLWTIVAAAGLAIAIAAIPESRRIATARAWCVITQHRVRTGCAQAWIHSRTGRLPFIVLTTCEPFGERVRVWCRAGVSAADFEAARHLLASACWAQDVLVASSAKYSQLVTLDVIRRSPRGLPPDAGRPNWLGLADVDLTPQPGSASEEGLDGEPGPTPGLPSWRFDAEHAGHSEDTKAWVSR
jgi:hypothetical protein